MARKATRNGAVSASVKPIGAVLRLVGAGDVAGRDAPAHFRQQDRARGDADDADRELVEPVGEVERRDRAGRQEARR